ncbi:MAG: disulfide bond formation protein B [Aestuariivita sp.]|nr:disulfide bond formation protein B [Aestuariivita sp.]
MSRRRLILTVTTGSVALLLTALAFQYVGGLPPCKLCIWQRWPHVGAIVIGLIFSYVWDKETLVWLGAVMLLTSSGIGLYHSGVEQGWWRGLESCTGPDFRSLSVDELLDQLLAAPLARCDQIPWQMFGLSMANWNAILSMLLAGIWILAAKVRS